MGEADFNGLLGQIESGSVQERRGALAKLEGLSDEQIQAHAEELVPVLMAQLANEPPGHEDDTVDDIFPEVQSRFMLLARSGPVAIDSIKATLENALESGDAKAIQRCLTVVQGMSLLKQDYATLLPLLEQVAGSPVAGAGNRDNAKYVIAEAKKAQGCASAGLLLLGASVLLWVVMS